MKSDASLAKFRGISCCILVMSCLCGCRQEMEDQQRLDAQQSAKFFIDRVVSRPIPEHAVAADSATWNPKIETAATPVRNDEIFLTGRENGQPVTEIPKSLLEQTTTLALLKRGQERFNISCVPCHDTTGSGNGMAARRGFPYPPTYHSDRLRNQPIGYFFIIATEGHNKMPPYGDLISTEDRWAIAAYVRALQFSQHASTNQLEPSDLKSLEASR